MRPLRPVTEPQITAGRSSTRLRVLPAQANRTAPREAVVDPAAARADAVLARVGQIAVVALALNLAWIALT